MVSKLFNAFTAGAFGLMIFGFLHPADFLMVVVISYFAVEAAGKA